MPPLSAILGFPLLLHRREKKHKEGVVDHAQPWTSQSNMANDIIRESLEQGRDVKGERRGALSSIVAWHAIQSQQYFPMLTGILITRGQGVELHRNS